MALSKYHYQRVLSHEKERSSSTPLTQDDMGTYSQFYQKTLDKLVILETSDQTLLPIEMAAKFLPKRDN